MKNGGRGTHGQGKMANVPESEHCAKGRLARCAADEIDIGQFFVRDDLKSTPPDGCGGMCIAAKPTHHDRPAIGRMSVRLVFRDNPSRPLHYPLSFNNLHDLAFPF